jgi:hypothetical protein
MAISLVPEVALGNALNGLLVQRFYLAAENAQLFGGRKVTHLRVSRR